MKTFIITLALLVSVQSYADDVFDEIDDYKYYKITCYADVRHNYSSIEELNEQMDQTRGLCKVVSHTPAVWKPVIEGNELTGSTLAGRGGHMVQYTSTVLNKMNKDKAASEMIKYCGLYEYMDNIEKVKVHKCHIEKLF